MPVHYPTFSLNRFRSKQSPELSGLSIVSQATMHADIIATVSARGSGNAQVENSITSDVLSLGELGELEELAELEFGLVGNVRHFLHRIAHPLHPYYQPLVQWVNRLRRQAFPLDKLWERERPGAVFSNEANPSRSTGGFKGFTRVI